MRFPLHSRPQSGAWASPPATAIRYSLFTIHYQNAFTVLELVMVIGVLSVLLAIILPTIKTVRAATLRRQAAAEATALVQAAIRYKTEYGFWPGQVVRREDDPYLVKFNPDYDPEAQPNPRLHLILYGPSSFMDDLEFEGADSPNVLKLRSDATPPDKKLFLAFSTVDLSASGSPRPLNPLNPKAIPFLDLKNSTDPDTIDYLDPWNQPYRLVMGLNPRDTFTFKVKDNSGSLLYSFPISNQTCFAFSVGPKEHHGSNYIYSAGVSPR